tara:strand:- start:1 stop:924 length:924 start_codon:yes stop_codon:yes gene_type:complete
MTYSLKLIEKNNKDADSFFRRIDMLYTKNNQDPISDSIKTKLFDHSPFLIKAHLILKDGIPVGILWYELTTKHYGNLSIYLPDTSDIEPAIQLLKEEAVFKKKILEIIAMDHIEEVKNACFKADLTANIRKRMYLWLNEANLDYINQDVEFDYSFQPYTKDMTAWAAKVSVDSHKISKDYEMYEEMIVVDKRKNLDDRVMNGLYGDIHQPSSMVLTVDSVKVGYILVVLVECWGYKQVPWVFDICVDPKYHGNGYGRLLANEMIRQIMKDNMEIMGLAVTLSNSVAMSLYQKQGFKDLDIFYEFVDP